MLHLRKSKQVVTLLLSAIFVLLMVGCQSLAGSYEFNGNKLDPPLTLPDFELMTDEGRSFQLSDTAGEINLVFFGYTFCPDVCPLTMADVKQALAELEGSERVNVLFITVDPERDTPEVLGRYVDIFGPEFVGLTDNPENVQEVMKAFGAFAEKVEIEDSSVGYLVNHTGRLYLIDPQGELVLTYPFDFEPEQLRSDLEYLLQTSET